jgi:hypothetical protein
MRITKLGVMTGIAIAEFVVMMALIAIAHRNIRVIVKSESVSAGPLETALDYESPDKKFEELVKSNPSWINHRLILPDNTLAPPILADCAELNRTNCVRILIAYGADVEAAVGSLNKIGAVDAIRLVRQQESEIRNQKGK